MSTEYKTVRVTPAVHDRLTGLRDRLGAFRNARVPEFVPGRNHVASLGSVLDAALDALEEKLEGASPPEQETGS